MPTDPNATPDPALDPTEGTPADESEGTAEDTQGSSVDWEKKYREAQKVISKQGQELGLYRQQSTDESDEDEEEDEEDEPEPQPRQRERASEDRLAGDSWVLAEQLYGAEAVTAYGKAAKLWNRAVTPADHVAAMEAYHEARLAGATPQQAASPQAQGNAPQPRIESNRPDEGPNQTEIDRKAEAAKAKGDSRGWLSAQLEGLGIR